MDESLEITEMTEVPAVPAVSQPVSLNRSLFNLAWPSLVENLLQTFLGFADMIFVGQLGAAAIAGVGLGVQWMFTLQVAFMGLAVGNTALVARAVGAGRKQEGEHIAKQSLILGALVSVVIAFVGFFFADDILHLMGAEAQVTQIGTNFLQIVAAFSIVMAVMFIGGGTLRGAGDTRTPMMITAFINVINIILSFLLVLGNFGFPRLGTTGTAMATTIARGIGAILILYVLFKRGSVLKLNWRGGWALHRDTVKRILNIGLPSAAEQVVFNLGFLTFSAIALTLGTNDLAAQQIAFNISNFSILPAFAFGVAALTLVGQNLGAKNPERAHQSAIQALRSGMVWMVLMGVGFVVFRSFLVGLYTTDPEVQRLGEMLMIFIALGQPFLSVSIVLGQSLRGAGDTRSTLVITFIGIWIIRVLVGYLVGIVLGLGLFGVWIGWIADFMIRALLIALRFRVGKWKTLKV